MEFTLEEVTQIYKVFSSHVVPVGVKEKIEAIYKQCPFCGQLFLHSDFEHHRATSTCNDDE